MTWSHAKEAADHFVIPTAQRQGLKSHLATIKTSAEQESSKSPIARHTHEVAVGWIGATDAEWLPHWSDVMSAQHGDPLAGGASDGVPWTRYSVGTGEDLLLTEDVLFDCGSRGRIVGGYDENHPDYGLGRNQYIQKTYGDGLEKPLPPHTAVHIELDFVRVDSWDGERAYMWVQEPANADVENPVWEQSFRSGGRNLCGSAHGDGSAHISLVRRADAAQQPGRCGATRLR